MQPPFEELVLSLRRWVFAVASSRVQHAVDMSNKQAHAAPHHSCCHPPLCSCMKSMQALNPAPAFILANQLADWELEVSEAVSGAESLGVFATEREAAVRRAA